jgi:hypothetical protein
MPIHVSYDHNYLATYDFINEHYYSKTKLVHSTACASSVLTMRLSFLCCPMRVSRISSCRGYRIGLSASVSNAISSVRVEQVMNTQVGCEHFQDHNHLLGMDKQTQITKNSSNNVVKLAVSMQLEDSRRLILHERRLLVCKTEIPCIIIHRCLYVIASCLSAV